MRFFLPTFLSVFIGVALSLCLVPAVLALVETDPELREVPPPVTGIEISNIQIDINEDDPTKATFNFDTNLALRGDQVGIYTGYHHNLLNRTGFFYPGEGVGASTHHIVNVTGYIPGTRPHYQVYPYDPNRFSSPNHHNFAVPQHPDPPDAPQPVISNIEVTGITTTMAVIEWDTHEPSTSEISYGSDNNSTRMGDMRLRTLGKNRHRLVISNLTPDSEYHFRLTSRGPYGRRTVTDVDFQFRTLAVVGMMVTPSGRRVITLQNDSYTGNPFELELDATFVHTESGTTLTLPGYYAGNDKWKVSFMPTLEGEWVSVTSSLDAELHGVENRFTVESLIGPGILKADPDHPKKWKYSNGGYVVPIAFRLDAFQDGGSDERFREIAEFLANEVHGQVVEFTLRNEVFIADLEKDIDWRDHQFDLFLWDRLERRMEILAEYELGVHIMLYTDGPGKPPWAERSSTEELLIRYMAARLASFPVVFFNAGIDLGEYRSENFVDWYGDVMQGTATEQALDPYGHPISSRHYLRDADFAFMDKQSFYSRGDVHAKIDDMIGYFEDPLTDGNEITVPISMDDAWHENSPDGEDRRKDFSEHGIRRAVWKAVMAGGLGVIIRGSYSQFPENGDDAFFRISPAEGELDRLGHLVERFEEDLESEQFLGLINPFIANKLGETFGAMVPDASLVSDVNGYALADPDRTKILYYLMGVNDAYDSGNGGNITLQLSGVSGRYQAIWFDPRTGVETAIPAINGGQDIILSPLTNDDWVLYLESDTAPAVVYGDANGDGTFDPGDLNEVVDWLVGRKPTPAAGSPRFVAADVNGDQSVDPADLNLMVDRLIGRIDKFPVEG